MNPMSMPLESCRKKEGRNLCLITGAALFFWIFSMAISFLSPWENDCTNNSLYFHVTILIIGLAAICIVALQSRRRILEKAAFQEETYTINADLERRIEDRTLMLEKNIHFLQTLIDALPNPVFYKNSDGKYLGCNDAFSEFIGLSKEKIIGSTVYDLAPFQQAAIYEKADRELMADGGKQIYETKVRDGNGRMQDVIFSKACFRNEVGEVSGIIGSFFDISERKNYEKALKFNEERYRKLTENAQDMIWRTDAGGCVTFVNSTVERLLGYTPKQAVGLRMKNYLTGESAQNIIKWISEAVDADPPRTAYGGEIEYISTKGERIPCELRASIFYDDQGEILAFEGISRDIREKRKLDEEKSHLEMQIRQQQKLEAIGRLAGGVAHEINNPLNGILNYAELIQEMTEPESKEHRFASKIAGESTRVAKIIRNLLSFARQDVECHSPAYITDIIEATLSLVGNALKKEQIDLEIDAPENLPSLRCRSRQIQQVILNLVNNARDSLNERYADGRGEKRIGIRIRPMKLNDAPWLRTTIEDNGGGIDPKIADKIFDPFFTTRSRHENMGMGLAVSHGIVANHNGKLRFQSAVGEYARFHIDLPLDST